MQINRLRLCNFRQHENTDLELGAGLTGIIGPNGAGKTTLLEAIAWAMYGMPAARGSRDTIRRRGAPTPNERPLKAPLKEIVGYRRICSNRSGDREGNCRCLGDFGLR